VTSAGLQELSVGGGARSEAGAGMAGWRDVEEVTSIIATQLSCLSV
jgi:hypothetical protein